MTDILDDDPNQSIKQAISRKREEGAQQEGQSGLTVAKVLDKRLQNIMPDKKKRDTFVGQLTIMRDQYPAIAKCTPTSILNCMIACGHLDLMPNTAQQYAFIIPYGTTAQFQLGYFGLIELAYRSGQIKYINASLVFKEDTFEAEEGLEPKLVHKPAYQIDRTVYQNVVAVYAVAKLSNGENVFRVLTMSEIDKIRETSKAGKGSDNPWTKWPEVMAKKTAIKQLLKYLPSSTDDNRFKEAVIYDDRAEGGKLAFNEDNSLDINAETQVSEAAERPKDRGVRSFAHAAEAEIVVELEPKPEPAPAEAPAETAHNKYEDLTADMTDNDLREAIAEILESLKLSKVQLKKLYEYAGSDDMATADRKTLQLAFNKLNSMVMELADVEE